MNTESVSVLLNALRSSDNEERRAAEAQYEALKVEQQVALISAITEVCATSADVGTITIGLVLLRKLFTSEPCGYNAADSETKSAIKGRILTILGSSVSGGHHGAAAGCVSALAVRVFQLNEDWPELWESVFSLLNAPDCPCPMKTMCCEIVSGACVAMAKYFEALMDQVVAGLLICIEASGEGHIALKIAAFDVAIKLGTLGDSKKPSVIVPPMIRAVQNCLNNAEWDSAERLTSCLAEGISTSSQLFASCTVELLEALMQVCSSAQVEPGVRHMAVETLLTYCESDAKTVRKVPGFATSFFELLFQYILQPQYPENWDVTGSATDEEDLGESTDELIGCAGLDRLSIALGGRKLHTTAQKLFMNNISSKEWQHRNGALLLICYCAEGMSTVFEKVLGSLISYILPAIEDEVKYVRGNALECITQLCSDFSPDMQLDFSDKILPPVIKAIGDPVPRVSSNAARCLDTFFDTVLTSDETEDAESNKFFTLLQPYVERVCLDCIALAKGTAHTFVREAALGALSSLISTCKQLLSPYVNTLVPLFQEVLANPDSPEILQCKCKAIECVTLLACGVGKEVFAPYTHEICNFLGTLSTGGLRTDDPRSRYAFRGWTCMVECLKEDVLPYMDFVMPALLHMMNVECDAVIEDANPGAESDDDQEVERCCVVIPGVGEKVAKFHTGLIEDKELASNIVNAVLQELGISLQPYFQDLATSAVKLLSFTLSGSIRENGALILGEIMDACNGSQNRALSAELAEITFADLMAALESESDADVMDTLMQTLSRCVEVNPTVISSNRNVVGEKLVGTLKNVVEHRDECAAQILAEQDEDELDRLHDENEELEGSIRSLTELIGIILEHASAVFTPVFLEMFLPLISTWLTPEKDDFMVCRGLVILCDFVEHSTNFLASSLDHIVPLSLGFATSRTDAEVLQSDFYLLSLLADYIGTHHGSEQQSATFAMEAHRALTPYFATEKEEKYAHCTTNALSAYVALVQNFSGPLAPVLVQMLEIITANLPAKDDEVEARKVHDRVLQWIMGNASWLAAVPGSAEAMLARIKSADKEKCLSSEAIQQLSQL